MCNVRPIVWLQLSQLVDSFPPLIGALHANFTGNFMVNPGHSERQHDGAALDGAARSLELYEFPGAADVRAHTADPVGATVNPYVYVLPGRPFIVQWGVCIDKSSRLSRCTSTQSHDVDHDQEN